MGKPTFNDLLEAPQKDLRRVYKLDDRGLEKAVKSHIRGATHTERRAFYENVYNDKRKSGS